MVTTNLVLKCHIHVFIEHSQGWGLYQLPWAAVPGMDSLASEAIFPISTLNLPWHSVRLFPLVLSLVTGEESLTPSQLHPPVREL